MNPRNKVSMDSLSAKSIQKIKKAKVRKNLRITIGIICLFVILFCIFNIKIPDEYRVISNIIFTYLIITDVFLFVPCVVFNTDIEDAIALFQSVSPNQLFIGKNFVVAEKNNVFLFFKMCTKGLFLIYFTNAQEIPGVEIKLPMFILGLSPHHKLENISFYKKTGVFAIPVTDETSLSGNCTVYFISDSKIMQPELGHNVLMQGISSIVSEL